MSKISAYTAISSVEADDLLVVVDVNDMTMAPSGTTKKMTLSQLPSAGVIVTVPAPTGATATDTPAVTAAISNLVSALASGPATLMFQDGTYQIDSNSAVIRSVANFTVTTSGRTVIEQAPNRSGLPNNTTGDIFIIADCTDFRVEGITFDGNRDTVAPVTALTATASSGQPSVTVASGSGSRYMVGQYLALFGGIGSGDQSKNDGFNANGTTSPLVISSITAGGGSGGGDLITFTANLVNTYSVISATLLTDGYGPYGGAGAFLTPYECGYDNTVAGRSQIGSEDQQNGLHLMNCQRFTVSRVTARNVWSSPIKLGAGIGSQSGTYANSCYDGIVTGNTCYHGYDQGVSVWISQRITVSDNVIDAPGWGGVVLTMSDYCTVTGNETSNILYSGAGLAGGGVVVEGGIRNAVTGNVVTAPTGTSAWSGISVQGWPTCGTWGLGTTNSLWPTLSAFTEQATAAGTSIQVSSTSRLVANGRYSIFDGYRTESVTVNSIVDGTHVTFYETLRFSHASGLYITPRFSQENVVTGNTVDLTNAQGSANGVLLLGSVRTQVTGNQISNWTQYGISLFASSEFCPPSSYNGGDGASVCDNVLAGGSEHAIAVTQSSHLLIAGNQIYGTGTGSYRGIQLAGCTDSVIAVNRITDIVGSAAFEVATGGSNDIVTARVIIEGNVIERSHNEALLVIDGDSLTIRGNVCQSSGQWGIHFEGVTNSVVEGNVCNGNAAGGIALANDGSSVGCTGNRVIGNTCRDDGSGVSVTTGNAITQPYGIQESGNSNYNLFTGNECDSNSTSQLVTSGAESYAWANVLAGAVSGELPAALGGTGAGYASGAFLASSSYAPGSQTLIGTISGTFAPLVAPVTTVASGSNGGEISTIASWAYPSAGVLDVASTAGYPTSGSLYVAAPAGTSVALIDYTGTSGGNSFTGCTYVSGSASGTVATGGGVSAASGTAVASTGSLTAPSATVLVTASFVDLLSASGQYGGYGLAAHGTLTPMVGDAVVSKYTADAAIEKLQWLVTGLTPGSSYNYDLMFAVSGTGSNTLTVYANTQTSTTPSLGSSGYGAPVVMTVQAV